MMMAIPLTGTLHLEDGSGDPEDPIRPIPNLLKNFDWHLVRLDLDDELMEIEVRPARYFVDKDNRIWEPTESQREQALDELRALVMGKTNDELGELAGCPRLKRKSKWKSL